jgi:hypothetical protein
MAGDIRGLTGMANAGVRQFETGGGVPTGQPVRVRHWGIPTMPGWFERPWKWNIVPAGEILELLRGWQQKLVLTTELVLARTLPL